MEAVSEASGKTESGSEAVNSLSEGLEGTPVWLDLHSVQRGMRFERVQGTMHVPGALRQDWGAPCLFHVLSTGRALEGLAVLLLV